VPRVGMLATVRNRRGIISAVEPSDGGAEGRVHLVTIEYTDADGTPEDQLIWEREPGARLLEPTSLPDVSKLAPMHSREFDALVRATRWIALTPFVDPDGREGPLTRLPIASPFFGAIQVEDFQLVPVLKALRMPRVALLLADDVGLGKTIEAGLILTELIIRRRVRRILIVCPASLRSQWKQEMRDKFSIHFDVVDRNQTHALRKRLGMDANPWRSLSRSITSYDYLKQPDVLEEFRAASRPADGSAHLPWDLLIVDEAHNLSPAPYGEDSNVSRMLGQLGPLFEHKLFLTATPHNGHTRSFSGLLETLDPVRFSRTGELSPAERTRIEQVLVRRLKREINAVTTPPRFCERTLQALRLDLKPQERALSSAFQDFRKKVRSLIAKAKRTDQLAGGFAVEILGKRLLSCPVAFADSWLRYQEGLAATEAAEAEEVRAAERAAQEETADDREAESRTAHAARTVGAWLKPLAGKLKDEISGVDAALTRLGLKKEKTPPAQLDSASDARFEALRKWIDDHLRAGPRGWRDDERMVIFTEYKTTLDYLERRLRSLYPEAGAIRVLFGGMDETERDEIKAAFNDPRDAVRILVATDAAAEGLNLQETARFLLHYDVPWNPARLEQRNGRLDRHGQARDVVVHHFVTDDDADVSFLAHVVEKVEAIRDDLGSTGDVFDAAIQRRLIAGEADELVKRELDLKIEQVKGRASVPRDGTIRIEAGEEAARLRALGAEIDLDPSTLKDTLEIALGIRVGLPRFEKPDARGRVRLLQPIPPGWISLVDDALRLPGKKGQKGPIPAVVFDPLFYIEAKGGRPVFRPSRDTTLLHLGHPLFQRALASFARARFPGNKATASRWMVRKGGVPSDADALILLTVEELANNDLRETFHHWVRTMRIPVRKGRIGDPLPHEPAASLKTGLAVEARDDIGRAREIWSDVQRDLRRLVDSLASNLTQRLSTTLTEEKDEAVRRERERFQSRQGELSKLIESQTLARLEREIAQLDTDRQQGTLFDPEQWLVEIAQSKRAKEEELKRRLAHYEELREQLRRERDRVIDQILPKRYAMHGNAQVFPVAVEVRLP